MSVAPLDQYCSDQDRTKIKKGKVAHTIHCWFIHMNMYMYIHVHVGCTYVYTQTQKYTYSICICSATVTVRDIHHTRRFGDIDRNV